MKKLVAIIFLILSSTFSFGQDSTSTRTLTYEEFINQVMSDHPIVFQSDIVQRTGEALVRAARGNFDPKLFGDINQKYFKDKQYYSRANGGITIPTWFGISGEAGYTVNDGVFLNPENRVPDAGLWYAGLRLELGNGLIIDKRRAELKKAKIYRESNEQEQRMMLNQLRLDASLAFWKLLQAYQKVEVYSNALRNARERFQGIVRTAEFGDRADIDTVEAKILVQDREIVYMEALTKLQNAEAQVELYMWTQGSIPLEMENVVPMVGNKTLERMETKPDGIDSLLANHPYLLLNQFKMEQSQVEIQLKREQLKPKLTLKYNAISEPINNNPFSEYAIENYTWGAKIAYPILTRKERGNLQLARLKLEDQKLKNNLIGAELNYKVQVVWNDYQLAFDQMNLYRNIVENNTTMYNSELTLFNLGESSVFMINSRENKLLKSQIKLIEVENACRALESLFDWNTFLTM